MTNNPGLKISALAAMAFLAAAAGFASAFSFYDIFAMFGIGAIGDAPIHHTVYLVSPMNNSYTSQTNDSLQFVYNHTGSLSGVVNCTLLLDDIAVNYTESVAADTNTAVLSNQTIAEDAHNWWVNCTNGTASESSLDIGWNFTFTKYITNCTDLGSDGIADNIIIVSNSSNCATDGMDDHIEIQYAVDNATNGTTIYLNGTFYSNNATVLVYGKSNITIRGNIGSTLIQYANSSVNADAFRFADSPYSHIYGFRFNTSFTDGNKNDAIEIINHSSNSVVHDITEIKNSCFRVAINVYGVDSSDRIYNVSVYNSSLQRAIFYSFSDGGEVYNNLVDKAKNGAPYCDSNPIGSFEFNANVYNLYLYNNTFNEMANYGVRIHGNSRNGTITNNKISKLAMDSGINFTIRNNTIIRGVVGFEQGVISDVTFLNNIIKANTMNNALYWGYDQTFAVTGLNFTNNVFYGGVRDAVWISDPSVNINFKNNIVYDWGSGYTGINFSSGTTFDASYNLVYDPEGGTSYNNVTCINCINTSDPLFDNATATGDTIYAIMGDFHLQSQAGRWNGTAWVLDAQTSPAIDSGDPADDYSQEQEPNGDRINMGAYGGTEYASKSYTNPYGGRNWYVATYGNNANDGLSVDTPKYNWSTTWFNSTNILPGDIIYLVNGTWYNETITIPASGNATHPITITAYNGTPTFDGVNKTKNPYGGINLNNENYIKISNLTIKRYFSAINNPGSYINISDCELGDMGDNIVYLSKTNETNNIIENCILYNAGWNTVQITGNTDPAYPATYMTIRNNTIYNSTLHNAIDLWRNVRYVTIEGNILYNNFLPGGNIYTHSGPSDYQEYLIIRNNIFRDDNATGIALTDFNNHSIIENNVFINKTVNPVIDYENGYNVTIRNNTVQNSTKIWISGGQGPAYDVLLDSNSIDSNSDYYYVSYGANATIRNPLGAYKRVYVNRNSTAILEYTDNTVFTSTLSNIQTYTPIQYYPDKSNTSIFRSQTDTGYIQPTAYNLTARPSSGYATITTDGVNLTSIQTDLAAISSPKIWNITIYSNDSATTATFNISTGLNSRNFTIYRNGTQYANVTTNSTGWLNYKYSGGFSTYEFSFQEQSSDTTPPILTVQSPLNQTYSTNQIWFNLTANEALNWSAYSLDSAANVSLTNSSGNWNNLSTVAEGLHNVTFFANDTAGNMNSTTVYFTVNGLNACGALSRAGAYYTLTQNVSSGGTCFNITANNVTLDGAGYWVNYSQAATGYGVNITGRNNVTVKNLNVVQGNGSVQNAYGIYGSGMTNSGVINNNITTSGNNGHGIYLISSSSLNTLLNNTITTSGSSGYGIYVDTGDANTLVDNIITKFNGGSAIFLYSATNTNITGGSIVGQGTSAYYLRDAGATNNFTDTNFTAQRNIIFYNGWFNYRNDSSNNIWLKTSIPGVAVQASRTLISWSNALMQWNDTNQSSGMVATYNITGLLVNTIYTVTNASSTGSTSQNLQTDAGGNLPSFSIALNGNTEVKAQLPSILVSLNSPANNALVNSAAFNCSASSNNNLANITLYGNWSGSWGSNGTANISGTSNSSAFTRTLSDGSYLWNCLAYDTTGNLSFAVANYTFTTDTIEPATITNLANQSQNVSWIYWNWTNPADSDFNHTEIWLNGSNIANTSNNFYNATDLSGDTWYQIAMRTADNAGNINVTWVNSSAKTIYAAPQITSYAHNSTYGNATSPVVIVNTSIKFNVTANQQMDQWNWTVDGAEQDRNYGDIALSFDGYQTRNVSVIGTRSGETTQMINWSVRVMPVPIAANVTVELFATQYSVAKSVGTTSSSLNIAGLYTLVNNETHLTYLGNKDWVIAYDFTNQFYDESRYGNIVLNNSDIRNLYFSSEYTYNFGSMQNMRAIEISNIHVFGCYNQNTLSFNNTCIVNGTGNPSMAAFYPAYIGTGGITKLSNASFSYINTVNVDATNLRTINDLTYNSTVNGLAFVLDTHNLTVTNLTVSNTKYSLQMVYGGGKQYDTIYDNFRGENLGGGGPELTGRNVTLKNSYFNKTGWSAFGCSGGAQENASLNLADDLKFINITAIYGGHNGFDIHGCSNVYAENITIRGAANDIGVLISDSWFNASTNAYQTRDVLLKDVRIYSKSSNRATTGYYLTGVYNVTLINISYISEDEIYGQGLFKVRAENNFTPSYDIFIYNFSAINGTQTIQTGWSTPTWNVNFFDSNGYVDGSDYSALYLGGEQRYVNVWWNDSHESYNRPLA